MLTFADRDDSGVGAADRLRRVRHRLLDGQRADHQRGRQRHADRSRRRRLGGDLDQSAGRREYRCGAVRFGRRIGAGAQRAPTSPTAARPLWFVCVGLGVVIFALGFVLDVAAGDRIRRAARAADRRYRVPAGKALMSGNPLADEVWRAMAALVIDNRDSWKRAVVERGGLAVQPDPGAAPAGQAADDRQAGRGGGDHGCARSHCRGQRPRGTGTGGADTRSDQPAVQGGVADRCRPRHGRRRSTRRTIRHPRSSRVSTASN